VALAEPRWCRIGGRADPQSNFPTYARISYHQVQNLRICGGSRPTSNLTTKREEKGEKDACLLPKLGWLATYVGYVPFVPLLSVLGGDRRGCKEYGRSGASKRRCSVPTCHQWVNDRKHGGGVRKRIDKVARIQQHCS